MHQPGADARRAQGLLWGKLGKTQLLLVSRPETRTHGGCWSVPQDQLWAAEQTDYLHHGGDDLETALPDRCRAWHAVENLGGGGGGWVAVGPRILVLCHQMLAEEQQAAQLPARHCGSEGTVGQYLVVHRSH